MGVTRLTKDRSVQGPQPFSVRIQRARKEDRERIGAKIGSDDLLYLLNAQTSEVLEMNTKSVLGETDPATRRMSITAKRRTLRRKRRSLEEREGVLDVINKQ